MSEDFPARACLPGSDAIVMSADALKDTLDWWQGEVDAYNARKRSALIASEYDCLDDDELAARYAKLPADSAYDLDDSVTETLTETDVRQAIADTDFRGLLAFAGLNQSQCARRFDIPLRTVQHWCGARAEARDCALYIRLMIAECMGLIGEER